MKKIILSTIMFVFALSVASAQLEFGSFELVGEGTEMDADIEVHTSMHNTTDATMDLRWVRTIVTAPDEWDSYACTVPGNCGLPSTNSLDFSLEADSIGELQLHFVPNGTPGYGEMLIDIIDNNTNESLGVVKYTLQAGVTSTNELEKAKIKLYPNPTTDYFQLTNTDDLVDHIVIYNILGKEVKYFNNNQQEDFYVGDLSKGIYLVQMIDADTQSTKTIKLRKN